MVFIQISMNVNLTMAVEVGGVVGPLSSRSDLLSGVFSACAQQDLLMWLKGVLVSSDAPVSLLETDTTDTLE